MKGIVAEINGKYAVVLTQTGSFKRVKASPDMEVGKEIDLDRPSENSKFARSVMKVTSLAAAGLLALGVGFGAYSYTLPYSYVHVDINPSVELTVNMFDRIIRAEALNAEGEALLSNNDLKNEKVDAGVTRLLNSAVHQGYLSNTPDLDDNIPARSQPVEPGMTEDKPETTPDIEDEPTAAQIANAVLVTVSSNNVKKSVNLEKELTDAVSVELDKDHVKSEILVAKTTVEQRNDARRFGVTPGKLVLIEDAMEGKSESELEELKKAAIKDLLVMATNKKMNKEKQVAEQKDKLERQKAEEAAKRKEEAERRAEEAARKKEEADKRKEETRRRAEEAAKKKEEEAGRRAEEAAKKKEAERKREEERKKAEKEREAKIKSNQLNQNRKKDQFSNRDQGDKVKKPEPKNQENKPNKGKITGQDLKKERERLKDEILNQMNNKKKEQDEKRRELDYRRKNMY